MFVLTEQFGTIVFVHYTSNPQWEEIQRYCKEKNLKSEDRPDTDCRLFKAKLDKLIKDIHKNKLFGISIVVIYTIEFQKRGLPHAQILLFLVAQDKFPAPEDIDRIISAEIPDPTLDPKYYEAVKSQMMHGPCGIARKNSPFLDNGHCSRHFPKKFVEFTTVNHDGYPVYRRRNDGRTIDIFGVPLDSCYVVPHNQYLLLKYGAHNNVEWCNQSHSIKYLFMYVNKGRDQATTSIY
ncbi:uncharacterized protein [Arachis hypogaea]|uniref:uncharacterized protein n=1 Tax=Arachis hypogaea TaxID=3818 RepID=UPI003B218036